MLPVSHIGRMGFHSGNFRVWDFKNTVHVNNKCYLIIRLLKQGTDQEWKYLTSSASLGQAQAAACLRLKSPAQVYHGTNTKIHDFTSLLLTLTPSTRFNTLGTKGKTADNLTEAGTWIWQRFNDICQPRTLELGDVHGSCLRVSLAGG